MFIPLMNQTLIKMKNIIPVMMLVFLLAMPVMMAKTMDDVEAIDWKTKKLMVTGDGIYDGKNLIKSKEKAEIWIYKRVGNTYHVDSLVMADTLVDVRLFYDVQPDTINYRSHNGKYEQLYTYDDWIWMEETDCGLEEYCGGYVILEATLEYGTGSNTFTGAISGATWQDDGINITLTNGTDYTQSETTFTISNINYAWSQLDVEFTYTTSSQVKDDLTNIQKNYSLSILNISVQFPTVGTIIGVMLLLIILIGLLIFAITKMMNITETTSGVSKSSSGRFGGSPRGIA